MNRELSFYNYLGQKDGMQIIVDTVNERYNNTNWKRDFVISIQALYDYKS